MEPVGVRHLKAHLSQCLRRVAAGERLLVTDRGRAVASIVPVEQRPSADWAHAMVARGEARWSGGKPTGLATRIPARGKTASRMVIEDRR
jgi:prevent-host-death family protein